MGTLLDAIFAVVVAIAMPMRAWRRHLRGAPPMPARTYLLETVLLIAALSALLWRHGVALRDIGLQPDLSWRFLRDLAICLAAVIGPDAWGVWQITRRRREAAALPVPRGVVADALASRPRNASFLTVTIVSAAWEELFFRATIVLLLPATFGGRLIGIVGGALLFGSHHLRNGITAMAYACIFGCLFAVLYLATDNLVAVIIAHAAGNYLTAAQWAPRVERARQAALHAQSPIFLG